MIKDRLAREKENLMNVLEMQLKKLRNWQNETSSMLNESGVQILIINHNKKISSHSHNNQSLTFYFKVN